MTSPPSSPQEEFFIEELFNFVSQLRGICNDLAAGATSEKREKEEEFVRLVAVLKAPETEEERVTRGVGKRVLWDMLFGEKEIEELGELDAMVNEDCSPSSTDPERSLARNGQSPSLSASADHSPSNSDISPDTKLTLLDDIDSRLTYRLGWPLLPILPVVTTYENVPKVLSPTSQHIAKFRNILQTHKVPFDKMLVAHRTNPDTQMSKSTLTLCVLITPPMSYVSGKAQHINSDSNILKALRALRTYILASSLTLRIELIDTRAFYGLYTLPILATEQSLTSFIKKKKHGIVQVLKECGAEVTSVDFYYRGLGKTRDQCRPTVVVGVLEPNRRVWWEVVMPKLRVKVGDRLAVEVCFRERSGL
jgi:hypothetical protein